MYAAAKKNKSPELKEESNEVSSSEESLNELNEENSSTFPNYLRKANDKATSADESESESEGEERNDLERSPTNKISALDSGNPPGSRQENNAAKPAEKSESPNSSEEADAEPSGADADSVSGKDKPKQSPEDKANAGEDLQGRKEDSEKQEKDKKEERDTEVEKSKKEARDTSAKDAVGESPENAGKDNAVADEAKTKGGEGEKAGSGPAALGDAAGGGGAPSAEGGGDAQGGNEQEGEDELEAALAKADPERAEADEEDPADVATAEDTASIEGEASETDGALESQTENILAQQENQSMDAAASSNPDSLGSTESESAQDAALQAVLPEPLKAEAQTENTESDAQPEEDPESVDGMSSDEPALGGAAVENSPPPIMSEPEKGAVYAVLGESAGGGGAGGAGGGGGAIEDETEPDAPDVASKKPEAALAAISSLPPLKMQEAMIGVTSSVSKDTSEERSALAADLPQMERPSGSPKNLNGEGAGAENKQADKGEKVNPAEEGQDKPVEEPKPLPEPPPSPAEKVSKPAITASASAEMSEGDIKNLSSSINRLPTSDPGLQTKAGPSPNVELSGNTDPANVTAQKQELSATLSKTQVEGQAAVSQEMGENTKIYPSFAPEILVAKAPAGGGAAGGAGGAAGGGGVGGAAGPEAVSFLAQKEKGGEIQAAIIKSQADIGAKREEYATGVSEEKAKTDKEIAKLETDNAGQQDQVRSEAQAEVKGLKGEWTQEQEKKIQKANEDSDSEVSKANKDIQKEKQQADKEASEYIDKGNEEAQAAKDKAEQDASAKKAEGENQSSEGFWGWLGSKATAFFEGIKKGIQAAFDLARKVIKTAIEAARKAAMWAIEQARKAIIGLIKAVGKALIAIGDVVLAGYPELHDKYTKGIEGAVEKSVDKVNEYADKLKAGVNALLDGLAAGLNWLVDMHEKAMLAVVDGAASTVDGAIKFGEKAAQALGVFAVLIKDISPNPGQWVSNLGAGAKDGIQNHLWGTFKAAVQEWFNSKLEQVLGLGAMVWDLIKSGGLSISVIGKMAWEGIKSLIPPTLIRILIEKVVAMIIPAAGAVMAVIEGLQAAWGAASRVIAAFGAFFNFLKAVKSGNSGPQFATALAAGAIAVIDFVANWLIAKLAKGAAKIGGKIKGLAKKLMGRKKGSKKAKKAKSKKDSKGKKKTKPKSKRPPKSKDKSKTDKNKKGKDKKDDKKKDKDKKKQDEIRKRVEKAQRELPPKIKALLAKKPSRLRVAATLMGWRIKYRMKTLSISGKGKIKFTGTINPTLNLGNGWEVTWDDVVRAIHKVSLQYRGEFKTNQESAAASDSERGEADSGVHQATTRQGPAGTMEGLATAPAGPVHVGGNDQVDIIDVKSGSKTYQGVAASGSSKNRSYREIVEDLKASGMSPQQLGDALGGKFAGADATLTGDQRGLVTELYGLLNFEATHPHKTMGHSRDMVHGLMQSQRLSEGGMGMDDLRQAPTAPMFRDSASDRAANTANERPQIGRPGIQAGTQAVTTDVVHGEGYGKDETAVRQPKRKGGKAKPRELNAHEEVRITREIKNFEKWMKTTGELERLEGDRKPSQEDLEREIKKRLDAYLARLKK